MGDIRRRNGIRTEGGIQNGDLVQNGGQASGGFDLDRRVDQGVEDRDWIFFRADLGRRAP